MNNIISMEEIRAEISSGNSPEAIAIKYGMELDEITKHMEKKVSDEKDILRNQLKMCVDLTEVARLTYEANPDEEKKALAVTSFVQTTQGVIRDLENLTNNDDKVIQLIETVIKPLVRNTIKVLGNEITEATDMMKEDNRLKEMFTTISRNFGAELTDLYNESVEKTGEIFNCSFDIVEKNNKKEGTSAKDTSGRKRKRVI